MHETSEAQLDAGLAVGILPLFRVPPRDVVPNAEQDIPEPGNPGRIHSHDQRGDFVRARCRASPGLSRSEC